MMILVWALATVAVVIAASVVAGRMGALSGRQPDNLGLREGRLKPPSKTPNSVRQKRAVGWLDSNLAPQKPHWRADGPL